MIKQLAIGYSGFFKFVENKPINPDEEYREDSAVVYKEVTCDLRIEHELIIKGLVFGTEFFYGDEPISEVTFSPFKHQDEIFNYMYKRMVWNVLLPCTRKGRLDISTDIYMLL